MREKPYCIECGLKKDGNEDRFRRSKHFKDGLNNKCSVCERFAGRKSKAKHYNANPELCRSRSRDWYAGNKDKAHGSFVIRRYGLNPTAYADMLASQDGRCAICRGVNVNGKRLSVDHDHLSGRVRGLLCAPCNTSLGGFRDNVKVMKKAIAYLEKSI